MSLTETSPEQKQAENNKSSRKPKPYFGLGLALLLILGLAGLGLWAAQLSDDSPTITKSGPTITANASAANSVPANGEIFKIYDLVVDPADHQTLFAATSSGLRRSSDGGQSWTDIDDFKNQPVSALALDGDDPERPIYVGTFGNGLFRSPDGGKTWVNLGLKNRNIKVIAAYRTAVYVGVGGAFAGMYRSSDAGKTFLPADSGSLPPDIDIRTIAIDFENPSNVYIGTGYTQGRKTEDLGRVKVSRDSGRSWNSVGTWVSGGNGPDPLTPVTVLVYAPGDRLYVGDGNKLYRLSLDRGSWLSAGNNLPEGVYGAAVDPQVPGIVYAVAKEGFYRNTGGQDWQKLSEAKTSPLFSNISANLNAFATLVPASTHSAAISVNNLSSTYLYGIDSAGQLSGFENRDFGKTVVAPVPGFKEPDFSAYNGVNPAARIDPPAPDTAPDLGRAYFSETGHYLVGGFKYYWDRNGGLSAFGYPLTEEFSEFIPGLNLTRTVQYFERVRLEFDPNAKAGQEVSVGLLGKEAIALKYYVPGRFIPNTRDQSYFPETKHTVRLGFYQFWSRGGLGRYGYPLSEEVDEKSLLDGKTYTVQYFERVKLEYNKDTKQVQLGSLGRDILIKRGWLK